MVAEIRNRLEGVTYASSEEARRWINSGAWIDATVGGALAETARKWPDRAAFISDERSVSFAELHKESDILAAAMVRAGMAAGDRAIFQLGTNVDTAVALVAAYKAGIVPVCAVPQYRELEIGKLIALSAARHHVVQADAGSFDLVAFAETMAQRHSSVESIIVVRPKGKATTSLDSVSEAISAAEAAAIVAKAPVGPRDVLSFQLSGGTTGAPKIMPRFHAEYLGHSAGWMRRYLIDGESRVIWSLPLLHNAGQLYALIPTLLLGVTSVLMPRIDIARMLELIEQHGVTHALSIGPIAPQLIAYEDLAKHDLSSLRLFATMGRADVLEAHLGIPCSNLFGITEGLLLGSSAKAPAAIRHFTHGASGCEDDEIRVVDEQGADVAAGEIGELWFRGPSSLRAYYGDAQSTRETVTEDGFVRSGDLMTWHSIDGALAYRFEGRTKDNINRGGEKIGCEEVEALVCRHPSISDAKLVAMPDPIYGEKGCIFVIARPGERCPDVAELAVFLVGCGMAKFKCPERVEAIDEFPVTRVGKLDRAALRERIRAVLEREQAAPSVEVTR